MAPIRAVWDTYSIGVKITIQIYFFVHIIGAKITTSSLCDTVSIGFFITIKERKMAQTSIIETSYTDVLNPDDGVVVSSTKRAVKKTDIGPTDEFIKVSKYLSLIFTYNNIPLNLVPISMMIAEEMEFKTNIVYLLKPIKERFANMLEVSLDRVNKLISECEKYNIIRRQDRGIYEVNSFLFSTGSIIETRELQAHFDIMNDSFVTKGIQTNKITGITVKKAVANKKNKQIPGQLSMFDDQQTAAPKNKTSFNKFPQNFASNSELEDLFLDN